MNYQTIALRLSDLPGAFKRPDANYSAIWNSFAAALLNYSQGADSVVSQTIFSEASGGWLDVWGQLLGFPRASSAGDSPYRAAISGALQAPVGSASAIEIFGSAFFGTSITVTENFPGYTITLPNWASSGMILSFAEGLARIRPAGVPVYLSQASGGFYLNTFSFIGAPGIAGPYLGGSGEISWPLGAGTPNSQPLLPSLILTDPVLNGGISL